MKMPKVSFKGLVKNLGGRKAFGFLLLFTTSFILYLLKGFNVLELEKMSWPNIAYFWFSIFGAYSTANAFCKYIGAMKEKANVS